METVFDHNPTPEEIHHVGLDLPMFTKHGLPESQDSHYALLADLYHFRRNKQKMDEYINKIQDANFQWGVKYSHYHYSEESERI
jgi:hypothetical protein